MTRTEKLTNAFKAGYDHCNANGKFAARLRIVENLRTFWESGYEKAQAEIESARKAYATSPEGIAEVEKDNLSLKNLTAALTAIVLEDWDKARALLNADIGL